MQEISDALQLVTHNHLPTDLSIFLLLALAGAAPQEKIVRVPLSISNHIQPTSSTKPAFITDLIAFAHVLRRSRSES